MDILCFCRHQYQAAAISMHILKGHTTSVPSVVTKRQPFISAIARDAMKELFHSVKRFDHKIKI